MLTLNPAERLIVAADYDPDKHGGRTGVKKKVLELAKILEGTGVYIKVNSIARACGYDLIDELHALGLRVFVDLKLIDIPKTMRFDGSFLREAKPEIVTVMCCAGIDGMNAVKEWIGNNTEVLGVTVLTSLNEEECQAIFTCSTKAGVLRFSRMAQLAGLGGLILSPKESKIVKGRFELVLSINNPGIRPGWAFVAEDDQSRILTPCEAIKNGADRLVIGRPITQAEDPREAVLKTIEEIKAGLKQRREE